MKKLSRDSNVQYEPRVDEYIEVDQCIVKCVRRFSQSSCARCALKSLKWPCSLLKCFERTDGVRVAFRKTADNRPICEHCGEQVGNDNCVVCGPKEYIECPECNGSGYSRYYDADLNLISEFEFNTEHKKTGYKDMCSVCSGTGRVLKKEFELPDEDYHRRLHEGGKFTLEVLSKV